MIKEKAGEIMNWNEWKERRSASNANNDSVEYYEDTHNERGEYTGAPNSFVRGFSPKQDAVYTAPVQEKPPVTDNVSMPMGNNQSILVYYPKTPEDVMVLINHLKRSDPAIVNLDDLDEETAQRILDFLSGAVCALSGSAHRISGNLFLLSPKGVEITIPYETK